MALRKLPKLRSICNVVSKNLPWLSSRYPPIDLATSDQSPFASSKPPNTYSQVSDHPEPIASLVVSISWLNVLTFVAASIIDSLVENFLRVSRRTSEVIQPSCKLSRNDFVLSLLTPMASAVSYKAFLNSSPPIPALTTEFQSIRLTLPDAKACDN